MSLVSVNNIVWSSLISIYWTISNRVTRTKIVYFIWAFIANVFFAVLVWRFPHRPAVLCSRTMIHSTVTNRQRLTRRRARRIRQRQLRFSEMSSQLSQIDSEKVNTSEGGFWVYIYHNFTNHFLFLFFRQSNILWMVLKIFKAQITIIIYIYSNLQAAAAVSIWLPATTVTFLRIFLLRWIVKNGNHVFIKMMIEYKSKKLQT